MLFLWNRMSFRFQGNGSLSIEMTTNDSPAPRRRGRPPNPPEVRLSCDLRSLTTEGDFAVIYRAARAAGKTLSAYVREVCIRAAKAAQNDPR